MATTTPFGMLIRYQGKDGVDMEQLSQISAELHANLWELKNSTFLDIGLMIKNPELIQKIVIQVPWNLSKETVGDLGGRLITSSSLIAAVFNENFAINVSNDNLFCECKKDENIFSIAKLTTQHLTIQCHQHGGMDITDIEFKCPAQKNNQKHYYRIRLQNIPKKVYANRFKQGDRFLLSSWKDTELIDFRINVKRGVPDQLLTRSDIKWLKFSKVHFFLLKDKDQDPYFQDSNYVGCRSLEDEVVWNEYVNLKPFDPILNMKAVTVVSTLAYQWTKKKHSLELVDDLTIMARFRIEVSQLTQLALFSLFVLLLGAISAGIWESYKSMVNDNPFWPILVYLCLIGLIYNCSSDGK